MASKNKLGISVLADLEPDQAQSMLTRAHTKQWKGLKSDDSVIASWSRNKGIGSVIAQGEMRLHNEIKAIFPPPTCEPPHGGEIKVTHLKKCKGKWRALPVRTMTSVNTLPTMDAWALTPINITMEDQRDDYDDKSFVNLVQSQMAEHKINENPKPKKILKMGKSKSTNKENGEEVPSQGVFKAIANLHNINSSAKELRKRYIELTTRCDSDLPSEFTPNIDGHKAESVSREKTLGAFHELFCRRCFKYDCSLHPSSTLPRMKGFPDIKPLTKACSPTCYMLQKPFPTSSSIKTSLLQETFNSPQWNGSDMSFFRTLSTTYSKDFCKIAMIMLTKTCQQVYEFSRSEVTTEGSSIDIEEQESRRSKRELKKSQKWREILLARGGDPNMMSNFTPCTHNGPCDANCACKLSVHLCEKFCSCGKDCAYRFPGCCCEKLCNTKKCPCYAADRECDPDLCKKCGADQICFVEIKCKNVGLQRKTAARLLIAPSDVVGWGVFLKEAVEKNDLISEYCGEIISTAEAQHRGTEYDKKGCSYLFTLNKDFVVDAKYMGNNSRFINHSINPNCYAKVIMSNGDHRIGVYAKKAMQPDEELFLDYNYNSIDRINFVGIEKDVPKNNRTRVK